MESIQSLLPLCDEVIVNLGNSEDETEQVLKSILSDKIKIIHSTWDDSLREGGKVLAIETQKAYDAIESADWCIYLQADEVLHEKDSTTIREELKKYKNDDTIDGFVLNYHHFYGSYDYIGTSSKWYQKEVRVVRKNASIYSYKDAQGFRKNNNEKLQVRPLNAFVHHYGWVKDPRAMQLKQESFHKLWHDDAWVSKNVISSEMFDYATVDVLEKFTDTHPAIMKKRIEEKNWKFDHDISKNKTSIKDFFKHFLNTYLGINFYYKNYKLIK